MFDSNFFERDSRILLSTDPVLGGEIKVKPVVRVKRDLGPFPGAASKELARGVQRARCRNVQVNTYY